MGVVKTVVHVNKNVYLTKKNRKLYIYIKNTVMTITISALIFLNI